jgi:hypothetical protein
MDIGSIFPGTVSHTWLPHDWFRTLRRPMEAQYTITNFASVAVILFWAAKIIRIVNFVMSVDSLTLDSHRVNSLHQT